MVKDNNCGHNSDLHQNIWTQQRESNGHETVKLAMPN